MRVLYYHQHFTTPDGASGTRSYENACRLIAAGHQVTMVCGSYAGGRTGLHDAFVKGRREGIVAGIRVIEFELPYSNADGFVKRTLTFLRFAWRSVLVALLERHDVLFATSTPLTAGIPGIVARWLKGQRFVFEVRDLWPELPREMGVIRNPLVLRAMDWLEWSCYHSAQACIGLSPGIVRGIRRRGIAPERVHLVPNGCDLALFSGEEQALELPAEVVRALPPNALVAAFTGSHGIANGLDAVLDAAAELKRRGRRDVTLLFVGDGKLKPALLAQAQREGLDNCVFLPPLPKKQLAVLMHARVDVGLMILDNVEAFYYGTSPNKFFDYLAAGKPVLTNYPGWVADLINESACGVAVPPEDPAAFADALCQLAEQRATLAAMGRAARSLAERRFDRRQLAEDWLRVIEGVHRGQAAV
ncbi:MAG TPA: glycosyltransferase family 4 protein [Accumulibacter sp.]|uniref:glycosyltransferase family 4 protein n=2 Tax=Accumulibacter sp. TaxID=2053492 RepID=UPI002879AA94|nr:glycosyltransferase family 4 protein [Accumulibacter sp.]MDS4056684.1 glycosyltransferase family 4 protein [Accumulibacter sp.]HMV06739.1 glycosyltransferase family 4 protein [Accumulibacter sp.]HMW63261.1 glycosyltransferase family 4 protein [Accumulibacter sp.]HNB67623.1 glycosyltransferase family 4 protein [Accumulibacter sp.]HNE38827.1 glycosyltransferase family 4 protein [Accumulibacter sp.]